MLSQTVKARGAADGCGATNLDQNLTLKWYHHHLFLDLVFISKFHDDFLFDYSFTANKQISNWCPPGLRNSFFPSCSHLCNSCSWVSWNRLTPSQCLDKFQSDCYRFRLLGCESLGGCCDRYLRPKRVSENWLINNQCLDNCTIQLLDIDSSDAYRLTKLGKTSLLKAWNLPN